MFKRFLALSYIVYDGKKIYLGTLYSTLKAKMQNTQKEIELEVYGFAGDKRRYFKKDLISEWGEN